MENNEQEIEMEYNLNRLELSRSQKTTALIESLHAQQDFDFNKVWAEKKETEIDLQIENLKLEQEILKKISSGELKTNIKLG